MVLSQYDIVSDQVFWKDFTESTDFFWHKKILQTRKKPIHGFYVSSIILRD